ncbi:MAG: type IV secretion protein Rhs [Paracoccaceae bacterium]|nr:MAG: type IV secretion protein Rhs [Paracoccaceae bacterium]
MPNAPNASLILKNRRQRLITELGPDKTFLVSAEIREGLSELGGIELHFLAADASLDIAGIVGRPARIEMDHASNAAPGRIETRCFLGWCIDCAYQDMMGALALFRATLKPWFWFLTLSTNNRIFQDQTVIDIIKAVLGDHGFAGDLEIDTRETYPRRQYCVQYRETDFDFLSRLMEEEGIYWFPRIVQGRMKIVLADDLQAHKPLPEAETIEFHEPERRFRRTTDHIWAWSSAEAVTPGRVTLRAYDFRRQKVVTSVVADPRGSHPHNDAEQYRWPGDFDPERPDDEGRRRARIRHEAAAAFHQRARAVGNVPTMAVGGRFTLTGHPRKGVDGDYLVVEVRHLLQVELEGLDLDEVARMFGPGGRPGPMAETYRNEIVVQPASVPFRAPLRTPRPEIPGVQTAIVVGKAGEEIFTDEFGRVKVQFHWDRQGASDEHSSCFIRHAVPWSGNGWGWQAIPRVGQEVLVGFLDGHPDHPVIIGMLYNGVRKPAEPPPGQMNVSGIRTNSTKGGGGYHELMFDDTKGRELVRFQSEKDYQARVKNDLTLSVGFEKADPGNYAEKIKNNMTTEIESGDHSFSVKSGKQTIDIASDRKLTVGGSEEVSVGGDKSDRISGNYTISVGPDLKITALSSIVLECGMARIEMTPDKITLSAPQIEQKADMTLTAEAGMDMSLKGNMKLTAEGGMQATLKGGIMATVDGGSLLQLQSRGLAQLKASVAMIN